MTYQDDIKKTATLSLPWNKLSGCNILVTGATGLIGGCLVDVLMAYEKKDYNVYVSGRNEDRTKSRFLKYVNDKSFHFVKYDVIHPLACDVNFQYIIHAASGAYPAEFIKHPVEIMKSNINGVDNLMMYGMQHGIKRLLYISSGEVYGEGDGRAFTEDYSGYVDCTSPRSCYPSSKRAAETLCISYGVEYGIDVVIARPCHVYGPVFTESDNRVYAQFIRNVLQGEDIVMKSTGEQFRSWCYVIDCISGLLHILLKGEKGEVYNIADKRSNITIRQLAELIAKLAGRKVIMAYSDDSTKEGYNTVSKSVFSTKKLETLGWNIEGCMKDKMLRTINHAVNLNS